MRFEVCFQKYLIWWKVYFSERWMINPKSKYSKFYTITRNHPALKCFQSKSDSVFCEICQNKKKYHSRLSSINCNRKVQLNKWGGCVFSLFHRDGWNRGNFHCWKGFKSVSTFVDVLKDGKISPTIVFMPWVLLIFFAKNGDGKLTKWISKDGFFLIFFYINNHLWFSLFQLITTSKFLEFYTGL